jgi:hypothetical protein
MWLRTGINVLRLETTATVRPADLQRGGDPRHLGMLVHGWRLEPMTARERS